MICKKCKLNKPATAFPLRKLRDGRAVPRKECKKCKSKRDKRYLAALSPEKRERRNRLMSIRQRRYAVEHPFYWMMKQVRFRAKHAPIKREVAINSAYLEKLWKRQKGLCALTGQPMILSVLNKRGWRNQKDRVSVDRTDPDKGYTKRNIQLVRAIVNICKNAYAQADFILICSQVAQHQKH